MLPTDHLGKDHLVVRECPATNSVCEVGELVKHSVLQRGVAGDAVRVDHAWGISKLLVGNGVHHGCLFTLVWAKVPQWLPHWVPKAKLGLPPSFCQFCNVLGQLCN